MSETINRPSSPEGDKDLANGWYWLAIGIGNKEKRPVELKDGVWQWGYAGGGFPKTSVFVLSTVEDPHDAVEAGYYWGRFRSREPSERAWIFDISECGQVRWDDYVYSLDEIEIICRVPTPAELAALEMSARPREPQPIPAPPPNGVYWASARGLEGYRYVIKVDNGAVYRFGTELEDDIDDWTLIERID